MGLQFEKIGVFQNFCILGTLSQNLKKLENFTKLTLLTKKSMFYYISKAFGAFENFLKFLITFFRGWKEALNSKFE